MTAVTVFNGVFCEADSVVKEVVNATGYRLVTDIDVIDEAARLSGMSQKTILRYFPSARGVADPETSERERVFSALRFAMASMAAGDQDLVFWGYMALLPPLDVEHMLRICLIDDIDARIATAGRQKGYSKTEAREHIRTDDKIRSDLLLSATDCNDPWDSTNYDLLIPVTAIGISESANLIVQCLADSGQGTLSFRKSKEDYLLESMVQADLTGQGHQVSVSARKRSLTVRFEDHQQVLQTMSTHLAEAASGFEGVKGVEVGVGCGYNRNDVFQRVPRQAMAEGRRPSMPTVTDTGRSVDISEDAMLAAEIRNSFVQDKLDVSVAAKSGFVSITINDHRAMLKHLACRLGDFVAKLDGVKDVDVGIGSQYSRIDGYMHARQRFAESAITDDKRVFALSLSERLRQGAEIGANLFADRPTKRKTLSNTLQPTRKANRAYSYR